jgi:hypothetical protein
MNGTGPSGGRAKNARRRIRKQAHLQNYFNYFTEIEEHFQRRRGTLLLLSTLDWALIATWQEAGLPLEAVLRGIDATFDKYEARKAKARARPVNGLAYCAQEVLRAAEEMQGAATGAHRNSVPTVNAEESGFGADQIARHLLGAALQLKAATAPTAVRNVAEEIAARLTALAQGLHAAPEAAPTSQALESLEQTLLALEDKLFAAATMATPEDTLAALREQSARELAPYRGRMQAVQIRQIEQQFLRRQLFETLRLPRLSLFYMTQL